ncbi:MAG TPA: cytochrome c-type biogenesis CcmF C-terminal domain-containing protein [Acidimicrobiia bacterium]|jgi:cytochrome c-type biogenesis protein CcmF
MIAVVGYLGILAALTGATQLVVLGVTACRSDEARQPRLRRAAGLFLGGAVVTMVALEVGIVAHDFTIEYVATNTARATPLVFLLASGWAALEGSIALWGLVLAGFTWWVARGVHAGDRLGAGALAVLGGVGIFWFGMMATVADPFRVCTEAASVGCLASTWHPFAAAVAPLDGFGPNPLLQNHILMAVHPPMLYLGYVGLSVPFAFAISALANKVSGAAWLERTHRWTVIAWTFLTLGILLGAWWSYEVLGWGGYWAWDPVENAAFLPWLVATAFLHSAVVQRRRGMLQAWNFVLIISTFALTILGTFLTRSGVIASVHSFTQSAVGPALLGFLAVVVVASFALFASRAHLVSSSPRLDSLASREGVFLLNNLLLTLFAFTVLIGTTYPLFLEGFTGRQVSVGRPFFDRITLPIAFALLLAMGVGPITPYRAASGAVVWPRIRGAAVAAMAAGAGAVLLGVRSVPVVIAVVLASFVVGVVASHFGRQLKAQRERGARTTTAAAMILKRERGYWGGQIAHVGVAIAAIGIATSAGLATRQEVRIPEGGLVRIGSYCVLYEGPFQRTEPNRTVEGAQVGLMDESCTDRIATMFPRVHRYPNAAQAVATPDVHTGLVDDVYLSLAGITASGDLILDVFVFPFQWLLWIGGLVTVGGGAWSLTGGRRRAASEPALAEASR